MASISEIKRKSALELAFVGDAVYELLVRRHIAEHMDTHVGTLHRRAVSYVCAEAQSHALVILAPLLNEDESDVVRRGRNATKTAVPRNGNPKSYRSATALEALFGYLELSGQQVRMQELFCAVLEALEREAVPTAGAE